MSTLEDIYLIYEILESDKPADEKLSSFSKLLDGFSAADIKAKRLSIQFSTKFLSTYPSFHPVVWKNLIEALHQSVSEEKINEGYQDVLALKSQCIVELQNFCKQFNEFIEKVSPIFCQLSTGNQDTKEVQLIHNQLNLLLPDHSLKVCSGIINFITNSHKEANQSSGQDLVDLHASHDHSCTMLLEIVHKLKSLLNPSQSKEVEEMIAGKLQQLLADADDREYACYMAIHSALSVNSSLQARNDLVQSVTAKLAQSKLDITSVDSLNNCNKCLERVASILSKNISSRSVVDFLLDQNLGSLVQQAVQQQQPHTNPQLSASSLTLLRYLAQLSSFAGPTLRPGVDKADCAGQVQARCANHLATLAGLLLSDELLFRPGSEASPPGQMDSTPLTAANRRRLQAVEAVLWTLHQLGTQCWPDQWNEAGCERAKPSLQYTALLVRQLANEMTAGVEGNPGGVVKKDCGEEETATAKQDQRLLATLQSLLTEFLRGKLLQRAHSFPVQPSWMEPRSASTNSSSNNNTAVGSPPKIYGAGETSSSTTSPSPTNGGRRRSAAARLSTELYKPTGRFDNRLLRSPPLANSKISQIRFSPY